MGRRGNVKMGDVPKDRRADGRADVWLGHHTKDNKLHQDEEAVILGLSIACD